jgi:hypothetical protein
MTARVAEEVGQPVPNRQPSEVLRILHVPKGGAGHPPSWTRGVFVGVATDLLHVRREALNRVPGLAELTVLRSDHGVVVHTTAAPRRGTPPSRRGTSDGPRGWAGRARACRHRTDPGVPRASRFGPGLAVRHTTARSLGQSAAGWRRLEPRAPRAWSRPWRRFRTSVFPMSAEPGGSPMMPLPSRQHGRRRSRRGRSRTTYPGGRFPAYSSWESGSATAAMRTRGSRTARSAYNCPRSPAPTIMREIWRAIFILCGLS